MRYCQRFFLSFVSIFLRECVAGFAGSSRAPAFDGARSGLTSTGVPREYPRRASAPLRPRRTYVAPRLAKFDKSDDSDERDRQDALARNQKRTDVRLFLTQRAIQSFVHLLLETRDPHTVRWIEVRQDAPEASARCLTTARMTCVGGCLLLAFHIFFNRIDPLRRAEP